MARWRQITTGRFVWTEDAVDLRFPLRLAGAGGALIMGVAGLVVDAPVLAVAGFLIVVVALVNVVALRLEADGQGVTVRNWLARHRLAWHEIGEIRVRSKFGGSYVEIERNDGRVLLPWATRGGSAGYTTGELDRIVVRLDTMRRSAAGVGHPSSLLVAVGLAESGDAALAHEMVELGLVDEAAYARLLAERGRTTPGAPERP